jgi:hypothetical protein
MPVTGIPSTSPRSSSCRARTLWTRMPGRLPRERATTVTSTGPLGIGRRSQRVAAQRWLSTASGPHASTAAIQWPFAVKRVWPTP